MTKKVIKPIIETKVVSPEFVIIRASKRKYQLARLEGEGGTTNANNWLPDRFPDSDQMIPSLPHAKPLTKLLEFREMMEVSALIQVDGLHACVQRWPERFPEDD